MEFKFKGVKINLPEGVEAAKFDANRVMANIPEDVLKLFLEYGIDLKTECPGAFLKGFTLNEKELAEVRENLKRYVELGMLDVIKANPKNLQIRTFKSTFMKRLVECVQKGKPYLNSDNTFADFLVKNEMELASATVTQTELVNAQMDYEANKEVTNADQVAQMTPEDKQVYNEIVERLNYLVLGNPMDTMLANIVSNATAKVTDAILRKEYKFLGIREMVESVMFDGIDVTPADNERITNLVLGAFPDEEMKMV